MLDSINTKRKSDDFEEKIKEVYDKYCEMDIDEKYIELWNAFVELIEYIQQIDSGNEMSAAEAINLMKELGMSNDDLKDLLMASMKNG